MTRAEDLLKRTRALIAAPDNWCQGKAVELKDGAIVRRDLMTAFVHARRQFGLTLSAEEYREAYNALWDTTDGRGFMLYNDAPGRTHPDVLCAIDQACVTVRLNNGGLQ